jgi:protein-S-isoprenylcysteine O-methyltransferase Ste14
MKQDSKKYLQRGAPFQLAAISIFLFRRYYYWPQTSSLVVALFIGVATVCGLVIFTWCLYLLYVRHQAKTALITSGVFKYTRHPMYTAFVLMDVASFFTPHNSDFITSTILFYGFLGVAAYFQEKETLARFGQAAVEYYRRTPRLFFFYPFSER